MTTISRLFKAPEVPFDVNECEKRHFYRGHRPDSFYLDENDTSLLELRARQRTFDGAYTRGALANLGYSLTILRLFDKRFANIGIVYAILAGLLYIVAFLRHRKTRHDFADKYLGRAWHHAMPTVGQAGKQNFGRPLTTATWFVLLVAAIVALVEVAFVVLIFRINLSDLAAEQGITKSGLMRRLL